MRHARKDYEAIQPWPIKRAHWAKEGAGNPHARQYPPTDDGTDVKPIIPDDEPVFLIRAQDVNGPATVEAWADMAEESGARPELVALARQWSIEMAMYAAAHRSKVPDCPAEFMP